MAGNRSDNPRTTGVEVVRDFAGIGNWLITVKDSELFGTGMSAVGREGSIASTARPWEAKEPLGPLTARTTAGGACCNAANARIPWVTVGTTGQEATPN